MHLEKIPLIDQGRDDLKNVEWFFRIGRDDFLKGRNVGEIQFRRRLVRRVGEVVGRQIREEFVHDFDGMGIVVGHEVDIAADRGVGGGTADFFDRGDLAGGGLDHLRSADEHARAGFPHDDEIHQRRGISRATGAGAGDHGDLRDDAGEEDIAEEDLSVTGKRENALLNARASGVVEGDDGNAGALGIVHKIANFLRVDSSE